MDALECGGLTPRSVTRARQKRGVEAAALHKRAFHQPAFQRGATGLARRLEGEHGHVLPAELFLHPTRGPFRVAGREHPGVAARMQTPRDGPIRRADEQHRARQLCQRRQFARPEQAARFGALRDDQHPRVQQAVDERIPGDVALPFATLQPDLPRVFLRRRAGRAVALENEAHGHAARFEQALGVEERLPFVRAAEVAGIQPGPRRGGVRRGGRRWRPVARRSARARAAARGRRDCTRCGNGRACRRPTRWPAPCAGTPTPSPRPAPATPRRVGSRPTSGPVPGKGPSPSAPTARAHATPTTPPPPSIPAARKAPGSGRVCDAPWTRRPDARS